MITHALQEINLFELQIETIVGMVGSEHSDRVHSYVQETMKKIKVRLENGVRLHITPETWISLVPLHINGKNVSKMIYNVIAMEVARCTGLPTKAVTDGIVFG